MSKQKDQLVIWYGDLLTNCVFKLNPVIFCNPLKKILRFLLSIGEVWRSRHLYISFTLFFFPFAGQTSRGLGIFRFTFVQCQRVPFSWTCLLHNINSSLLIDDQLEGSTVRSLNFILKETPWQWKSQWMALTMSPTIELGLKQTLFWPTLQPYQSPYITKSFYAPAPSLRGKSEP